MNNRMSKKCATWHKVIIILLSVILLVTPQVQAQEQETLILYEVTESNFPPGDGLYKYDMTGLSRFELSHAPDYQLQLEERLEEGYDFESLGSAVINITIEAIFLEARNWTDFQLNGSYTVFNQEQIFFIKIIETDIDFTRTLAENETMTIEILDSYHEFSRTFLFQMIPFDYGLDELDGFLKLKLTVSWELQFLIWQSAPTTSSGEPIMAIPVLGTIGLGLVLLVYYFREEK